jgi:hypothetical protein
MTSDSDLFGTKNYHGAGLKQISEDSSNSYQISGTIG